MATKTERETKKENVTHERSEGKKVELIKSQELKPKQTFTNLDTGAEEKLEVKSQRLSLVPFSGDIAKHFGGNKEEYHREAFRQASEMVQPVTEQIEAFLEYATRDSYQAGKKAALSGGNYLSPELRKKITDYMGNLTAFSGDGWDAAARFKAWSKGFAEKKPGAIKILETVTADEDVFSDLL